MGTSGLGNAAIVAGETICPGSGADRDAAFCFVSFFTTGMPYYFILY